MDNKKSVGKRSLAFSKNLGLTISFAIHVVLGSGFVALNTGPTEEELILAKKNIIGGFPLRVDSNSKILNYVVVVGYYKLPLDYLRTFNSNIEAVTIEHIKDAFKRRLTVDNLVTVKVGTSTNNKNKEN